MTDFGDWSGEAQAGSHQRAARKPLTRSCPPPPHDGGGRCQRNGKGLARGQQVRGHSTWIATTDLYHASMANRPRPKAWGEEEAYLRFERTGTDLPEGQADVDPRHGEAKAVQPEEECVLNGDRGKGIRLVREAGGRAADFKKEAIQKMPQVIGVCWAPAARRPARRSRLGFGHGAVIGATPRASAVSSCSP